MDSKQELRKKLKKEYSHYKNAKWSLDHMPAYGDWYHMMRDMQIQHFEAQKKVVDSIMTKLGYEKWSNEDIEKELKIKPATNQSRTLKENGENNQ
jgi:hypothetical protein